MSKTVLQEMTNAAEAVLREYAAATEPLRNLILRRECAARVALTCKRVMEDHLDKVRDRRRAHRVRRPS